MYTHIYISVYKQAKRKILFHIDRSAVGARIYFRNGTIARILMLRQLISLGFCTESPESFGCSGMT